MEKETNRLLSASFNEYMQALPEKERIVLEELRNAVRSMVPDAEEVISYGIPTFKCNGKLIGFAAFKNHCSLFPLNSTLTTELSEHLKDYKTSPGTIQFTVDKPLPVSLIKKIVMARMRENEAILLAKKTGTNSSDAEKVEEYMRKLVHPLKAEIEVIRNIIKGANNKIAERIKWNAPSYYYKEDLVTFNIRATKHVHLVFHQPAIVNMSSALLEGNYKDRRMVYLQHMQQVEANKKELQNIVTQLVAVVENK
jgi:uncharacterized protein YdhG (YjbR/CyaY superfamily)